MAGNHDVLSNLKMVFGLEEGALKDELAFRRSIDGHILFFLDSSTGRVSDAQLKWLTTEAASLDGEALLFVHHPPLECGCLFMDQNYPMVNRDQVFPILVDIPNINNIFCGHYHTEKTVVSHGKSFFLCPSTMIFFGQDDPDFKIDFSAAENFVGWRTVDWDGENLKTRTCYLSTLGSHLD
jgi:Icc protein